MADEHDTIDEWLAANDEDWQAALNADAAAFERDREAIRQRREHALAAAEESEVHRSRDVVATVLEVDLDAVLAESPHDDEPWRLRLKRQVSFSSDGC